MIAHEIKRPEKKGCLAHMVRRVARLLNVSRAYKIYQDDGAAVGLFSANSPEQAIKKAVVRYLIIILLLLASCAHQPFPEGEPTSPPIGYIIHCWEHPDSPFCRGDE